MNQLLAKVREHDAIRLFGARFLAGAVNQELALAEGMSPELSNIIFMPLMAAVIAISMKIVGVLLVTALLIIPAATARRLATGPEQMAVLAFLIGAAGVLGGLFGSLEWDTPAGPSIVVAALLLIVLSQLLVPLLSTGNSRRTRSGNSGATSLKGSGS